ncbi:MAG: sensor histidine kinase [Leptolyngbya sp. DLM2.Bin15]|nr:MAG: sensor histidine kinase [Leptolyngbya sp. DLM2.Bin15]
MANWGLRSRLFFSHIIVMVMGLSVLIIMGKFSSPRFFIIYLRQIEGEGYTVQQVRTQLIQGFETAWSRGALWSVVVGASAAGGLSYWSSRRIMQPLEQMESITQKFSTGHMDARVPSSEIPELDRLASGFNRMAADLEGVEQRRRDLVGDLAHELRTPLTIVEGYLEGLADGTLPLSDDVYQKLIRETRRMRRLVNDLQELSKLEAGSLPINAIPLNLQPLLITVIERFSSQLADDSPTLSLDYPADIPMVLADAERVEQILGNLIGNALRYTPAGTVTVQVTAEASQVWVAITDTGIGIAPEDLPHVFERFWRADRSRDRHSGGSGIGLAICRRLVELQGGVIEVTSDLDQGSTFRFCLPTAP